MFKENGMLITGVVDAWLLKDGVFRIHGASPAEGAMCHATINFISHIHFRGFRPEADSFGIEILCLMTPLKESGQLTYEHAHAPHILSRLLCNLLQRVRKVRHVCFWGLLPPSPATVIVLAPLWAEGRGMSFSPRITSWSTCASTAVIEQKQQELGGMSQLQWGFFAHWKHKREKGNICVTRIGNTMLFFVNLSFLHQICQFSCYSPSRPSKTFHSSAAL